METDTVWDVPITLTSNETAHLVGALVATLALLPEQSITTTRLTLEALRDKIIQATGDALVGRTAEERRALGFD